MKSRATLLILLLISLKSFSQPAIEWQKSYGGSITDVATSIQQTSDGGYIAAGYSLSYDGDITDPKGISFFWVVKLSPTGILEWEKSLGSPFEDYGASIKQTSDGGYIVAGQSHGNGLDVTGNHESVDYWVVKLNAIGDIEWQKSLGGSQWDGGESIQQTSDGGYIVAGQSESNDGDVTGNHGFSDMWVVKLTPVGNIEWQRSYGGSNYDSAWSIQQTTDDGYIVAGASASSDGDVTANNGISDYWVLKLDNTGSIEWQKSYGGSEVDYAFSIQQTADGGYITAGMSGSIDGDITNNQGGRDFWVVKLTDLGVIEWQKSLGGTDVDSAHTIIQTPDEGYLVAGWILSNDGDVTANQGGRDFWVVKLSTAGTMEWQKSYGGSGHDRAQSIKLTLDGGFIVAGGSASNNGDVTGNHGSWDFWIVKFASILGVDESDLKNLVILSPNPNTGRFALDFSEELEVASVQVVDILGKTVFSEINIPNGTFAIDENFTSGVYFVNVVSTSSEITLKMIVE